MVGNLDGIKQQLEKLNCEEKLIDFFRYGWHILEPGTELKIGWVLESICDHLEAVTRGDIIRLLITVPPGTSKSLLSNVFWPAWEWGPMDMSHKRYISFAHKEANSERDTRRCGNLIRSEWYMNKWGDRVIMDPARNSNTAYDTMNRGFREVGSVGGGVTGRRADRLICDDLHSVIAAESEPKREGVLYWFAEELSNRLNSISKSAIVVIMQRVHEMDVAGMILEKELGYHHLMIPMHFEPERRCYSVVKSTYMDSPKELVFYNHDKHAWQKERPEEIINPRMEYRYNVDPRVEDGELMFPELFPHDAVENLEKTMAAMGGSYAIAGQMQQRPAPRSGGMFKRSDWIIVDEKDVPKTFANVVRGWDLAATKDGGGAQTAGVKIGITHDDKIYVMDSHCGRWGPNEVITQIKNTAEIDGKFVRISIPQDPGQAGKVQKSSYAAELHGYDVSFSPETGDKETRAIPFAAQVEAGNVYLVRGSWNSGYINEAAMFPRGQLKDRIDASSRAYGELIAKKKKTWVRSAPRLIYRND